MNFGQNIATVFLNLFTRKGAWVEYPNYQIRVHRIWSNIVQYSFMVDGLIYWSNYDTYGKNNTQESEN